MKRYKFSLQSALRARRAQEDVARQRLAISNHKLRAAQASLDDTIAGYRSLSVTEGDADHDQFIDDRARQYRSADAVERARQVVENAQVEAATCFAAWVDTAKQVRSLDRLDERRREEWRLEDLKEEAVAVDDVVAARWAVAPSDAQRTALT